MELHSSLKKRLSEFFFSTLKGRIALVCVALLVFFGAAGGFYFLSTTRAAQVGTRQVKAYRKGGPYSYGDASSKNQTYLYGIQYTDGDTEDYKALCLESKKTSPTTATKPSSGVTSNVYDFSGLSSDVIYKIKAVALASPLGDVDGSHKYYTNNQGGIKSYWSSYTKFGNATSLAHSLVAYLYDGGYKGWTSTFVSKYFNTRINEIVAMVEADSTLNAAMSSLNIYRTEGGSKQDLVWIEFATYEEEEGTLTVQKFSNLDITSTSSAYTLIGAEFTVYTDETCASTACTDTSKIAGVLTITESDGTGTITLPVGTYYVRETKAPTGFDIYDGYSEVIVNVIPEDAPAGEDGWDDSDEDHGGGTDDSGESEWDGEGDYEYNLLEFIDEAKVGSIKIKKIDAETGTSTPVTSTASIVGTVFEIYTCSSISSSCSNPTAYDPTGEGNTLTISSSDGTGTFENLIPGKYMIKEKTAGTGYLLNTTELLFEITTVGETIDYSTEANKSHWFSNQVIRGDFNFTKTAEYWNDATLDGTNGNMSTRNFAYVPFLVKKLTSSGAIEEQHVILANASGVVDTSANSSTRTSVSAVNKNDSLATASNLRIYDTNGNLNSSFNTSSGIWFGTYYNGSSVALSTPSTTLGALPYGEYEISEISVYENAPYDLLTFKVNITENGTKVSSGTKTNNIQSDPSIGTTATASDGSSKEIDVDTAAKIKDTITYSGLVSGTTYTLKTELVTASGTTVPLLTTDTGDCTKSSDSTYYTCSVTASGTSGSWNVNLVFASDSYTGESLTVLETLFLNDVPIAGHRVLGDSAQTVTVKTPGIKSSIATRASGTLENTLPVGITTFVDSITFSELVSGTSYVLKTSLRDKDSPATTYNFIKSDNSLTKTIVSNFTYSGTSGAEFTEEFTYKIDTTALVGKSLVVYNELYESDGTTLIGTGHPKMNSGKTAFSASSSVVASETVAVGSVTLSTVAFDGSGSDTSDKIIPISSSATIKDNVTYSGIVSGTEYTLTGIIVLKDNFSDSDILTNSSKWLGSATETKTLTSASGTWSLTFNNINTLTLTEKEIIVIETLSRTAVDATSPTTLKTHPSSSDSAEVLATETVTVESSSLSTNALNADVRTSKNIPFGTAKVVDVVTYSGLTPNETYTLSGELVYKNSSGVETVVAEGWNRSWTASSTGTGTVEVSYSFDSTPYLSASPRVFSVRETLCGGSSCSDTTVIKTYNSDLTETSQQVTLIDPSIETIARNGKKSTAETPKADLVKELDVSSSEKIVDKVIYENLAIDSEYKVCGTLYELTMTSGAVTGYEKLAYSDSATKNCTTFTPTSQNGYTEVTFDNLDTRTLIGKTIGIVEELYYINPTTSAETKIFTHNADLTDTDEMVYVKTPSIGTTATAVDMEGEDEKVLILDSEAKLKDVVTYSGLIKDQTYCLVGEIHNKKDGTALGLSGTRAFKAFAASAETVTATDGVEMIFSFDSSSLPGRALVVYEYLYYSSDGSCSESSITSEVKIAEHEDLTSAAQSFEIAPYVGTKVVDKLDNNNVVGVGDVTVVDTVAYEGLKADHTYKAYGKLVYKETGEVLKIDGEEIVGESEVFTADSTGKGAVPVTFEFNSSSIMGTELIAFEELVEVTGSGEATEEVHVASHEDLDDDDQLLVVKIASLETTAVDTADGDKLLDVGENASITDTVDYRGLVPEETYILIGVLMDKSTGKPVELNGETFEKKVELIPTSENGSKDIIFEFNSSDLAGRELVVFETLTYKDVEIAAHEDLDDESQTVKVKTLTPNTGFFSHLNEGGVLTKISVSAVVIGALGAVYVLLRRQHKIRF
ncbi:VaFE repeat-containing surface-anchored protein [Candidatus Saccharibacteria bacterium]|nr:VaFE repeat-containing surface-anchored protein [Candidatus Saccharibacteria bacterium]